MNLSLEMSNAAKYHTKNQNSPIYRRNNLILSLKAIPDWQIMYQLQG